MVEGVVSNQEENINYVQGLGYGSVVWGREKFEDSFKVLLGVCEPCRGIVRLFGT
nr:MAG TPA_asm: hypothetical protein [Caudoviricetes sp.]DAS69765.1 MAG TPA: hypothetical protein [Caudoviricetes sp.]